MEKIVVHNINTGSFLSLTRTPLLPDDFNLMEMEPLSGPPVNLTLPNPNGHFTTKLLTGFRCRLRINANKQMPVQTYQEWDLETLLTSTDHGPNVL